MNTKLTQYQLFILLEPYVDNLEINSPFYDIILNAPIEEWDKKDFEAEKKNLKDALSDNESLQIETIINIFNDPHFAYKITLTIDNQIYINELYERDERIIEFMFDSEGKFEIEEPLLHDEKINDYFEILNVSEYEIDYSQSKIVLSIDEYIILNVAFSLEQMSRDIGEIDQSFVHFTLDDIIEEFSDESYKDLSNIITVLRDENQIDKPIDISKQVDLLVQKDFLTKLPDDELAIGDNAEFLFNNLFLLNDIQFSFVNVKYFGDSDDTHVKNGMFRCTSKSVFYFYFENKNVVIDIISGQEDLKNTLAKAFTIN